MNNGVTGDPRPSTPEMGKVFFDLQVANPLAGGVSPILRPEEYYRLGFKILPYGIDLILRVTRAMQVAKASFMIMASGRASP